MCNKLEIMKDTENPEANSDMYIGVEDMVVD